MPTIIESITKAEETGAELKKQAAARAKEITDDALARREEALKAAHEAGRACVQRSKDEAERQGAALAAELAAKADKEAEGECARAEARLRAAAEYIVKEVVKV